MGTDWRVPEAVDAIENRQRKLPLCPLQPTEQPPTNYEESDLVDHSATIMSGIARPSAC